MKLIYSKKINAMNTNIYIKRFWFNLFYIQFPGDADKNIYQARQMIQRTCSISILSSTKKIFFSNEIMECGTLLIQFSKANKWIETLENLNMTRSSKIAWNLKKNWMQIQKNKNKWPKLRLTKSLSNYWATVKTWQK